MSTIISYYRGFERRIRAWPKPLAVYRAVTVRERLLALLTVAHLLAQKAELSGLITDPTGLAAPGARVVVQRAATGATRTVSSNEQGEYSAPALLPGRPYDIAVEANGVKSVHQNGVVVEVDQRARLDFATAAERFRRRLAQLALKLLFRPGRGAG